MQAYTEIEKTESLEKLYDFLYSSQWEIKYFKDKKLDMLKQQAFKLNSKAIDEILQKTPIYTYCTRVIGFYQEMLDLIKPFIEWRQIMYWSYTTMIITPKNDSNPSKSYNLIYQTSLSTASQVFNRDHQELDDYLLQKRKERPSFSPLIDETLKKIQQVAKVYSSLCKAQTEKVRSSGFIPSKETRQTFYIIIDLVSSLLDIKNVFELESKILEKKLQLDRIHTQKNIAQKTTVKPKPELEITREVCQTENSKVEDLKAAEETFKIFEIKQRKKIDEYKAEILERRKIT